ncbi:MAG: DUF72 domain-containing protein [Flavobacteriales bacterium]|nr:DUF72 domain-containing protein [Flavobacteriales bacterium]MDG1781660.1 DUF72 domain-containing protein [Flavobacteriales bacterium]MDG2246802.1 DUF72 domain-containing protein [Flavobacteriales bacterium]
MKFGKLDDIRGIDFSLPADHPQTNRVLSREPVTADVFCGGTMWNIPKWKGKIYGEKTPIKNFMSAYFEQFGTIELNATHYRIHPPPTIEKWADAAPDDFVFCPKFPQLISHFRRFVNCEGLTDEFINAILRFEKKLGPCFIQLPPNFAPKHAEKLTNYLKTWPRELRLAIEFRHADWFTGGPEAEATWELMEKLGIGSVISDTSGRRDALHMRMTAPFLMLRFGGNNLHPTDDERLESWVLRIQEWQANGLDSVFLLMHQPDSINTPESCISFGEYSKKHLQVSPKVPHLITGAQLF